MKQEKLSESEIDQILKHIPANHSQGIRIMTFLGENPYSITVDVNRACAVGNISHVARKLNKMLEPKFGLMIGCEFPHPRVPNRFGELSQMFKWGVYRLPNKGFAANDPVYEASKSN